MRKTETGFVALFTCIMISMLLLVITIGLISIQSLQLRKSEDSEQSLRAYYAAESGVEDAVSKVLTGVIASDASPQANICNGNNTFDTPGLAGWTCQYISFSGNPTGRLEQPDAATTVDTGDMSASPYQSIIVSWNQSQHANTGNYYSPPGMLTGTFPPAAGYNAAPPLEIAMLEYPNGGFGANQVCTKPGVPAGCKTKLQNILMVPTGPGGGATVTYANLLGHGPWRGSCGVLGRGGAVVGGTNLNDYNCYAVITGFPPGSDYLFRIRSKYTASSYRMIFKSGANGTGNVVKVPDGTATIDVTAKAGQTYRRVISKLPLGGSAEAGLNYVIYSDTDVCKNFDVFDNVGPANPSC